MRVGGAGTLSSHGWGASLIRQEYGCAALAELAKGGGALQDELIEARAMAAVADSMKALPGAAGVHEHGAYMRKATGRIKMDSNTDQLSYACKRQVGPSSL